MNDVDEQLAQLRHEIDRAYRIGEAMDGLAPDHIAALDQAEAALRGLERDG